MEMLSLLIMAAGGVHIIYLDFMRRWIHLAGIALLFCGSILYNRDHYGSLPRIFTGNVLFLILLLLLLHAYFFIKRGKAEWIINRQIGGGDLLVMLALCISYNVQNYIMFLICSCIVALLFWGTSNFVLGKRMLRIPLAGVMILVHLAGQSISRFVYQFDPLVSPIPLY